MELELERFLSIRATDPNTSPSSIIDEEWHKFILQTKKYRKYCIDKFGFIIHHSMLDSIDQDNRKDRLKNTYKIYKNMFGELNNYYWKIITCNKCNVNLDSCYFPLFNCCKTNHYCDSCVKKSDKCYDCNAYNFFEPKFITAKDLNGHKLKIGINNKNTVADLINICSSLFNKKIKSIVFAGAGLDPAYSLLRCNFNDKSLVHVL
jgi:hypothetical protein